MPNPEYLEFMRVVTGKCPDCLAADVETSASEQEIGWWKKFQIGRAIHHARYGKSTPVEIHLLITHGIPVSLGARKRSKTGE